MRFNLMTFPRLGRDSSVGNAVCRTRERSKGCEIEFRQERPGELFSSPELTLRADSLFSVRSTPILQQKHVKDPGHPAKNVGGAVVPKHANTLEPTKSQWADCCPGIVL